MKFPDDISNMNTYIHTYVRTYIRTSRNQYAPPLFQSWGHKNMSVGKVCVKCFEFAYMNIRCPESETVSLDLCQCCCSIMNIQVPPILNQPKTFRQKLLAKTIEILTLNTSKIH